MLNVKKIEAAMVACKISKKELCDVTRIARTTLDAILKGSDARISTIETISKVLNVRIGFLFDEETEVKAAGRDYVEKGKIEHRGTEYNGTSAIEEELRAQIAILKSQLDDKERIIKLLEK